MTNNNIIQKTNLLNNTVKSNNKIKLFMYKGQLAGNIIDTPITPPAVPESCTEPMLDFSCQDNSMYIGVV